MTQPPNGVPGLPGNQPQQPYDPTQALPPSQPNYPPSQPGFQQPSGQQGQWGPGGQPGWGGHQGGQPPLMPMTPPPVPPKNNNAKFIIIGLVGALVLALGVGFAAVLMTGKGNGERTTPKMSSEPSPTQTTKKPVTPTASPTGSNTKNELAAFVCRASESEDVWLYGSKEVGFVSMNAGWEDVSEGRWKNADGVTMELSQTRFTSAEDAFAAIDNLLRERGGEPLKSIGTASCSFKKQSYKLIQVSADSTTEHYQFNLIETPKGVSLLRLQGPEEKVVLVSAEAKSRFVGPK